MDTTALKVCNLCQRELAHTEFHRSAAAKDGLQSNCKKCRAGFPSAVSSYRAVQDRIRYLDGGSAKRAPQRARWKAANPEKTRQSNRESRKRMYWVDPEKHRARAVAWNQANPDKTWLRDMRRRAKRWGVTEFTATYADWQATLEAHDNRCHYCGAAGKMHTEHKIPFARGGQHVAENIVPACLKCNVAKHQLTDTEYREVLARRTV